MPVPSSQVGAFCEMADRCVQVVTRINCRHEHPDLATAVGSKAFYPES